MFPNAKGSELLAILATLDPSSQAAGTATTGWISVANHHGLLAIVQTGVLGTGATLDAKLQQAQDASGTGAKDITGKAITQILKAIAAATQNEDINLPVMAPPRWHNSRRSREAEYARVILNIDRHNTVKPKPRKGLIGRILSFFR